MKNLNKSEEKVYKSLVKFSKKFYNPSIRDICKDAGFKSPASIYEILNKLIDKNIVYKYKQKYLLNEKYTKINDNLINLETISIPVLGKVAAGQPIYSEENFEYNINIDKNLVKENGNDKFGLKVDGDSMINIGVNDGDILIVEKTETISNGELGVFMTPDWEITFKRFKKTNDKVILISENDNYEDMVFDNVTVIGKPVALYRNY